MIKILYLYLILLSPALIHLLAIKLLYAWVGKEEDDLVLFIGSLILCFLTILIIPRLRRVWVELQNILKEKI